MIPVVLAAMLAAAVPAPLQAPAQTQAAAPVAAAPAAPVDPVRLAAARALIDQIMPPAKREQMIEAMLAPMMANMNQAIAQNPRMAELVGNNAKAQAVMMRFIERQTTRTMTSLRGELPAMAEAMSRAYARRFDGQQLKDISAFFATPSGQAYIAQSASIMSDPDVLAWQSRLMAKSMDAMHDDIGAMTEELTAELGTDK